MALKTGPLSREELLEIWRGTVDPSYRDPLLRAGDGNGLEVYNQSFEQLARVSRAVDVTTQALYIAPWSGQTSPAASGEARATVSISFARSKRLENPLVLSKGFVFVEEETTDASVAGPEIVRTGRRYVLTEDLVFHPGERGPFDVVCLAERPGYGYNNPLPGTLRFVPQPGSLFENDVASVSIVGPFAPTPTQTAAQAFVATVNEADTYVPEHVGQYTLLVAGANAGMQGRIVSFKPPVPPLLGSTVEVALDQSFDATTFSGTFAVGETIRIDNAGPVPAAYGRVLGERVADGVKRVTFVLLSGGTGANTIVDPATATGVLSGATADIRAYLYLPRLFVAETATASWRVLDWVADWGLEATNALSPTGGLAGMLDELGNERNLHRGPGETDEVYRQRIRAIADVVSPNAIRRTLNRVLGSFSWCFREVGRRPELPGWFYDGDSSPPGGLQSTDLAEANRLDAYDTDVLLVTGVLASGTFIGEPALPGDAEPVQLEDAAHNALASGYFGRISGGVLTLVRKEGKAPTSFAGLQVRGLLSGAIFDTITAIATPATVAQRRFRYYLDYTQFRAFFLIGVPRLGIGEFGMPYDGPSPSNAYDAAPYLAFYDGYAVGAAAFYARLYQAIDAVRAGGVTFDLYVEDGACP